MTGIPASLYLFDTCCSLDIIATSDLVTHFQLFSYQLNDTIPSIGIAEHCSFTSYGGAALQIGLAEGCSCWDERLYYSYSIRQYGLKWGSSFLMPLVLISCSLCEILASICESTNLNPFNATGSVQFAGLKIGNWTYDNSTAFSQDYTTIASLQQPA